MSLLTLGPGRGLLIWGYFTAISPEVGAGGNGENTGLANELVFIQKLPTVTLSPWTSLGQGQLRISVDPFSDEILHRPAFAGLLRMTSAKKPSG